MIALAGVLSQTSGMRKFLRAIKDREHRLAPTTWIAGIAAVVYAFVPIDLIPELVLGPLGFGDDIGIWAIFAVLFMREQRRWQDSLGRV
ncbi:uncharacterized membrane protein YkvA (DUF1232 family) [Agromyces sp. 3263]|uniref:DUF1232 domain-containing protein n=1 Tax=Agromyces sp. 3263 TaxID=2817750 RepID=UPI0028612E3B|nr:DUF1232 domain-containing protein [Agromyces sp. 3263]MDR6906067.1 uncharacterized membrane protein YkvA (DUF1232 family) [Agromyces sp. 3263]